MIILTKVENNWPVNFYPKKCYDFSNQKEEIKISYSSVSSFVKFHKFFSVSKIFETP